MLSVHIRHTKKCPQISRNGTKFFKARNKSVSICEICGNKITRSTLFGIFGFARVHYIIYCNRSLGCGGKSHFGLTYFFFQVFVNIERTLNIQPSFCIYEFFVDFGIISRITTIYGLPKGLERRRNVENLRKTGNSLLFILVISKKFLTLQHKKKDSSFN